jgi:PhnB protein
MPQLNPYLHFNGNCREAMTFYKECLGGELTLQTVGETPAADKMPAEARKNIMHARLAKGDLVLMASDMSTTPLHKGNSVSLALNCTSEEEIRTLFAALSAGGKVLHPIAEQFWGAIFGSLTDKYGFDWLLNYEKNQKA